ncbi:MULTISPECIES: hypothetical protein [Mumia]|uniref:hypothetical protein n=1 Tax=Mumia TaxID=1546255 RepID=UPI001420490C|nr:MULTISPECIES: hypothetical protein [unclassified Mumia]QMW66943.1 hypothetical protein H4N58_03080 [Mumia sp. ZJ1417]
MISDTEGRGPRTERQHRLPWLLRRWPTALGIGSGAFIVSDMTDGSEAALVLVVAALGYIATAVLDRQGLIWAVVAAEMVVVVVLRIVDVDPIPVLAVAAVALALVGAVRRRWGPSRFETLYPWLTALFLVAGLVGAYASPVLAGVIVGLALIAHAAWDAIHWHEDAVVSRPFAEWCGTLDFVLGIGVLVLVLA